MESSTFPEQFFPENDYSRFKANLARYDGRLVNMVSDEAHTSMDWGKEFRPALGRYGELRSVIPSAS